MTRSVRFTPAYAALASIVLLLAVLLLTHLTVYSTTDHAGFRIGDCVTTNVGAELAPDPRFYTDEC